MFCYQIGGPITRGGGGLISCGLLSAGRGGLIIWWVYNWGRGVGRAYKLQFTV